MKVIKKNPTKYKIPRNRNAYCVNYNDRTEFVDNFVFETTLEYTGYMGIDFCFKDSEGNRYIAKISKFDEMIQKGLFGNDKKVTATFTFYKIGGSYTVGLYNESN